ncbi:hypothetical protein J7354_14685 [Sulfitobacter sp. R18_2]|uniref:hypothetical protein n=1 Tax=Sulfitobacter sp. R18_2 TaxID=2821105 RepID=UPI001ADA399A|nr:hypothetical protein [Sulfitobacter sp. R18_2]MBO9439915.1 hypothetical protein [Sulfitobacter sp. R18_2]|tara:strand:+ start:450 stop:1265 length:816 start_codon:yes stop_codon:yes gene_type:complete
MARLPIEARLWKEKAELDYIGPFIKAWAAFNAWFRHETQSRSDRQGLTYVRDRANPVRAEILPLLRPIRNDEHGRRIADTEEAQEFKLLIAELHSRLEAYRIEVFEDERLNQISFRSVCLNRGVNLPQTRPYNRHVYTVTKAHGQWSSEVRRDNGQVRFVLPQDNYDLQELIEHHDFVHSLSPVQQDQLRNLYQQCNPRPLIDLTVGGDRPIQAGDIAFHCQDTDLYCGLIEVIYSMRNALLHGELQPQEQAFRAYEPAYRIVMKFLDCVR